MTDNNDIPPKGGPRPADNPGQKRPHATLDLKAVEVKAQADAKAAASAGTTPPPSQPSSAAPSAPEKPAASAPSGATLDPKAAGTTSQPEPQKSPDPAKSGPSMSSQKPPESKKVETAVQRSGGFGRFVSHMAAGLAGGMLALAGADRIAPYLGTPSQTAQLDTAASDLQNRIASLEQAAKAAPPASGVAEKLAESEARLAKLEEAGATIASIQEAQTKLAAEAKALTDKIAETNAGPGAADRLAKLEDRLATLAAAAETGSDPGRIQGLAAITGKMADLETSVANQMTALRKSVPQEITNRLGEVAESSEAAKTGAQRADRELQALKTDQTRVSQRVESLKADADRAAASLRAVQEEQGALTSAVNDLKGAVEAQLKGVARPADVAAAVAPVATKLSALEANLQGVVKGEEDRKINAERIVVSLELANLKRALDQGKSYAAELAEVKSASGGRLDVAALDRYKDTGVPALADLQKEFREVANAVIDAEAEPVGGSVIDHLVAGAKSVVRVRKVSHDADDTSAEAIVGRMDNALQEGNLSGVLNDAKTLPEKARTPAGEWLSKVEARTGIDRAIAAIEGQLKASLGGTPPASKAETAPKADAAKPAPAAKDQN